MVEAKVAKRKFFFHHKPKFRRILALAVVVLSFLLNAWVEKAAALVIYTPTFTPTPIPTLLPTPTALMTPTMSFNIPATPTPVLIVALTLDQNFFNPSQQQLGMDLKVDRAGQVKVVVYNIVGEEVKVIQDAPLSAGNYRVSWDGRNKNGETVGNAVYFIVINSPSGHMTRQVIVLK